MVFCNEAIGIIITSEYGVTILILIDGFLQSENDIKNDVPVGESQSLF